MDIELRHLRYCIAVAEERGFTAASRRVHVAQQVLSAQIRQLEDLLGAELFERTSRGARLTPAGEAFVAGSRLTLQSLERAVSSARNLSKAIVGELSVGLSVAAGGDIPTRLLKQFETDYPEIKLRLKSFELDRPAAGLLDYSTDVAFVRPPVDAPGIELLQIATEERVFVLPADHPLAGRQSISVNDVTGMAWVAAPEAVDGCTPDVWRNDWLGGLQHGEGASPVIGAVARTIDEWREHVVAGRGVSLCPASAESHYGRPGLVFVPSLGCPPAALCLAWRGDEVNPAVARFVEVARFVGAARS